MPDSQLLHVPDAVALCKISLSCHDYIILLGPLLEPTCVNADPPGRQFR